VTLDEALYELGVQRGAGAEAARRAYLRLLKVRKPEADPEGFRRLREAYEIVRGPLAMARVAAPAARIVVVPSVESSSAVPTSEPHPAPEPPPPRAAHDLAASEPDFTRLEALEVLCSDRRWKEAAESMTELHEAAVLRPGTPLPPPFDTVTVLLALHEDGLVDDAARLERAFAAWLQSTGNEVRALAGVAPAWGIARDLGALPPSLSPRLRRAMARCARPGEFDHSLITIREMPGADARRARADARLLRARGTPFTTSIASLLAPTWREWWTRRQAGPWSFRWRYLWFAIMAMRAVPLLLSSVTGLHDARPYDSGPRRQVVAPDRTLAGQILGAGVGQTQAFIDEAMRSGNGEFEAAARKLQSALQVADCNSAPVLARRAADAAPPDLRKRAGDLAGRVKFACHAFAIPSPP
jgi:hypothetical protein